MVEIPSLVGRTQEIDTLSETLERMLQGSGRLVLVSGEAGIGKTALVQHQVAESREHGALVLTGAAFDLSTTPPYGPWLELIRTYPPSHALPPLPEFFTSHDAVAALGSQEELHRAVLAFFQEVAAIRPLVLVLEDLHWSDQPSLELLRVIARATSNDRIMLIGTWRDDEVTRRHPLYQLMPALVRESDAERVDLRALDEEAIRDLIRYRFSLNEPDEETLVGYLLTRAGGNPLFTLEILRTLELEGILREKDGAWRLSDLPATAVPSLVRQMVERRVSDLSEETVDALQVAAVLGQVVSLERWEQVADEPVGTAAEEALETHLMEETSGGDGVAFRHALIREAIYEMVTLPRRRQLHRQVAEIYLKDSRPDPEIVAWHLKQGHDSRAVDWLILAGEQAEHRFAWQVALERHEDAASLLRERGDNDQLLARLLLRMGRLLRFSDQSRAGEYLELSRQEALRSGDEVTAAFALFYVGAYDRLSGPTQPRVDKMLDAIEILTTTEQDIGSVGRWAMTTMSAELDPLRVICGSCALQLALLGRFQDAIAIAKRYLPEDWDADPVALPESSHDYAVISDTDAYGGLAFSFAYLGLPDKAALAFKLRRDLTARVNFRGYLLLQQNDRLLHEHFPYRTSDLQERTATASLIESETKATGQSLGSRNSTWGLEYCYLMDGRWDLLRSRIRLGTLPSMDLARFLTLLTYGRLALYEGETERCGDILAQLMPAGPDEDPEYHVHRWPGEAQRLGASLALEVGDLKRAREWMTAHDAWMDWTGAVRGRAEGLLLWGQIHFAEGDEEAALDAAYRARHLAQNPEQPIALIAAHRFLGQLATQVQEFDAAQEYLHQSLDLAERCALPYERALSLQAQAELQVAQGNPDVARNLLTEVRRIATDLGAQPMLRRAEELSDRLNPQHTDGRFGLSPRESEVLRLLVRGMSDKDIAEELFISHRTVSHHVSNILRKLDVETRTAAATRAAQRGYF